MAAPPASAIPGRCPRRSPKAIHEHELAVVSVLSGNRNFEGRVNHDVRANYLASPPLVVAYALAGSIMVDLATDPLGTGTDGEPVYLKDIWPSTKEIAKLVRKAVKRSMFRAALRRCVRGRRGMAGDQDRQAVSPMIGTATRPMCRTRLISPASPTTPAPVDRHRRCAHPRPVPRLDHHRPHLARGLDPRRQPGRAITSSEHGVEPHDFNSYGSRRGNHEVMMRGTFANIRIKNQMVPGHRGRRHAASTRRSRR